jgi:hypothetical protein
MSGELVIFRPETGEEAGVTCGQPQVTGEYVLSWAAALRAVPETRDLPEQMCGLSAARSKSTIAAAGPQPRACGRTWARVRRADAVTREGGVTATPPPGQTRRPS